MSAIDRIRAFALHCEGPSYAALRMVSGLLFSFHGMQKIFGWLWTLPTTPAIGSQLWFGGVIELVTGLMIALGLLTRPAALLASGTMAVAYFQFHWKLDFTSFRWLPAVNKGEPAALNCFLFLYFAARGAGSYALDNLLSARVSSTPVSLEAAMEMEPTTTAAMPGDEGAT